MSDGVFDNEEHQTTEYYEVQANGRLKSRASKHKKSTKRNSSNGLLPSRSLNRVSKEGSRKMNKKVQKGHGQKAYAITKLRRAERLSKELHTSIYLLSLTPNVGTEPVDASSNDSDYERTGLDTRLSDNRNESLRLEFESNCDISAEATTSSNGILGVQDWPEDQQQMIQKIEALQVHERSDHHIKTELPSQVQKAITASKDALEQLSIMDLSLSCRSTDISFTLLEKMEMHLNIAVQRLGDLIVELEDQTRNHQSESSLGSMSSGGSQATLADDCCRQLGLSFQNLLDGSSAQCLQAMDWLKGMFEVQNGTGAFRLNHYLSKTLDILRVYRKLLDYEVVMCTEGIGLIRLMEDKKLGESRIQSNRDFIKTINSFVIRVQEQTLKQEYMSLGSSPFSNENAEKRTISKFLTQCWDWLKEVSKKIAKMCVDIEKEVYKMLFETLYDAVIRATTIQDTSENRKLIKRAHSVERHTSVALSESEFLCQQWLLACILKLHSHAKDLVRDIVRGHSLSPQSFPKLPELQEKFRQLILVTISRMTRSTIYSSDLSQAQMESRRYYGMQTTTLLKKYLEGHMVDHRKPLGDYEIIKQLMDNLLGNIFIFDSKLQNQKLIAAKLQEHKISDQFSNFSVSGGDPAAGILFNDRAITQSAELLAHGDVSISTSVIDQNQGTTSELFSAPSLEINTPFGEQDNLSDNSLIKIFGSKMRTSSCPKEGLGLFSHPHLDAGSGYNESIDQLLWPMPSVSQFESVNINDIEILNPLGSGSSATVYLMNRFGAKVAGKIGRDPKHRRAEARINKEAEMHKRANNHPNIVRYLGKCTEKNGSESKTIGIIMEYCDLGNLTNAIRDARWMKELDDEHKKLPSQIYCLGYHLYKYWIKRLNVACDVAAGMCYLHSQQIVHRDLTSYNVLLLKNGGEGAFCAKVCDLERSNYIPDGETLPRSGAMANSPPWSAPEILTGREYTTKADVFSMGVILWELMYLENPWDTLHTEHHANEVAISCFLSNGQQLPLIKENAPKDLPEFPQLIELVKASWQIDPGKRPSIKEFHEMLEGIRNSVKERLHSEKQQKQTNLTK